MNVNTALSRYATPEPSSEFTRAERKKLLLILRRLQFLEQKDREETGLPNPYNEKEMEALEWILVEVGFLAERPD